VLAIDLSAMLVASDLRNGIWKCIGNSLEWNRGD